MKKSYGAAGAAGEALHRSRTAGQPDRISRPQSESEQRSRIEQQHPQPIPPDEQKQQQNSPQTPAAPA